MCRFFQTGKITKSRVEVNEFDKRLRGVLGIPSPSNYQWYACVTLKVGVLIPTAVITQFPTMIHPEHNNVCCQLPPTSLAL